LDPLGLNVAVAPIITCLPLLPGLGKVFPPIHQQNSAIWQKIPLFFGFSLFLFWELKQVLFALFSLNKFVFNTPNKNFSQAVSLCFTVDAIEPTVHLLLIYFKK
jgi:hypothetical protein